jgi:hypothetical protein
MSAPPARLGCPRLAGKWPATSCDFGSADLSDEIEWLDAVDAVYEAAIVQVVGVHEALSVVFVPATGRAGVARWAGARWLHASSLDDAVARYLRGEGTELRSG